MIDRHVIRVLRIQKMNLPRDCLHSIFWFLPLADLARVSNACRNWHRAVTLLRPQPHVERAFLFPTEIACEHARTSALLLHITHVRFAPFVFDTPSAIAMLQANRNVAYIDIREDALVKDDRVEKLARQITMQPMLCSLRMHLFCSDNSLASLVHAIRSTAITHLHWTNIQFQKRGFNGVCTQTFANMFSTMHTLCSVNLSQNDINYKQAQQLLCGLAQNPNLTHLDISSNNLGDICLLDVAKILTTCKQLTYLNLSDNLLISIRMLTDAIAKNPSLVHLEVSNNFLCESSFFAIAKALASNTHLQTLTISYIPAFMLSIKQLAHAIQSNESLTHLDFSGGFAFQHDDQHVLEAILFENKRLKKIIFE